MFRWSGFELFDLFRDPGTSYSIVPDPIALPKATPKPPEPRRSAMPKPPPEVYNASSDEWVRMCTLGLIRTCGYGDESSGYHPMKWDNVKGNYNIKYYTPIHYSSINFHDYVSNPLLDYFRLAPVSYRSF